VEEAPRAAGTRHGNRMGIARESFGNNDILGCVWEPRFWDQLGTLAFWELHGNDHGTLLGLHHFWDLLGTILWDTVGTHVLGTSIGTTSWDMFGRLRVWEHFGTLFWEQVGKGAFLGRRLGAPGAVWEVFGSQSFPLV
jgi:hypothetical protein